MPSAVFPICRMRRSICMDRQQKLTAYDVVNGWSREEIRRILFEYGEERYAPPVAAAIGANAQTSRLRPRWSLSP